MLHGTSQKESGISATKRHDFERIPSITERVSCLGVDLPGALKSLLLRVSELKRISATAKNTARKKRTFCNSRTFDLLTHASLS